MSIYKLTNEEAFRSAVSAGRVVPWEPLRKDFATVRILALERRLFVEMQRSWGGPESPEERLRQKILATFDSFVGDRFALRLVFKQTSRALGTAEMRILNPKPGARIMGGFLSETVFVGTSVWFRNSLPFKFKAEQAGPPRITHRELNEATARALAEILGEVSLHRPLALRR